MALVTCSRCFAVFEAEGLRPGQAPLCPDCGGARPAAREPAPAPAAEGLVERAVELAVERVAPAAPRPRRPTPTRPAVRRRRWPAALVVGAIAIAAVAGAIFLLRGRRSTPVADADNPIVSQGREWRADGVASAVPPGVNPRAIADQRIAAGRAALASDLPERNAEALRAFRDALAADASRTDALAGWVIALASQRPEAIRGEDLAVAHELLRWARDRSPDRPELVAAYARLLLAVPSDRNRAEALSVAWKAGALAPRDPDARLALGLSRLDTDPAGAVRVLDADLDRPDVDRRLLTAAARARWAAGDHARAMVLADRRLALDAGHGEALELEAEILLAGGRVATARAVLQRFADAHPAAPRPLFLQARLAAQVDRNLAEARRLLAGAMERHPDELLASRVLAQAAAVERAAGDGASARKAVEEALRRFPASAPAQFQAALLAFGRGDARALREATGVLGDRGGSTIAAELRARSAELSQTAEEAIAAWEALVAARPRDPAAAVTAAGAAARLGFAPKAIALCAKAFERDLLEGTLARPVGDFWDGAPPVAESGRRLLSLGRADLRTGATIEACAGLAELLQEGVARAEPLARRALGLSPQAIEPTLLTGYVALARGKARVAADSATAALELHPGHAAASALRARALEAIGRRLEAQGAWREALEAAPDLASGRLALARLLAGDGRPEEARPLLEALVRDDPGAVEAVEALRALGPAPASDAGR
jgi:tetratricopeptide (TPR) repeat protein